MCVCARVCECGCKCVCVFVYVSVCVVKIVVPKFIHKKTHNSLNYADEPYPNINELRKKAYSNYMRLLVIELNQWLSVAL